MIKIDLEEAEEQNGLLSNKYRLTIESTRDKESLIEDLKSKLQAVKEEIEDTITYNNEISTKIDKMVEKVRDLKNKQKQNSSKIENLELKLEDKGPEENLVKHSLKTCED